MAIGVATTCTGVASGIVGPPFLCLRCSCSTHSVLACLNNDMVRDAVLCEYKDKQQRVVTRRHRSARWSLDGTLRVLAGGTRVQGCLDVCLAESGNGMSGLESAYNSHQLECRMR